MNLWLYNVTIGFQCNIEPALTTPARMGNSKSFYDRLHRCRQKSFRKFIALAGKPHSRVRLLTRVFSSGSRRLVVPRRGEEHRYNHKQ